MLVDRLETSAVFEEIVVIPDVAVVEVELVLSGGLETPMFELE